MFVNSAHHQSVDNLGKGLEVNSFTEDGVIEGIENPNQKFCIGVQWHPERSAAMDYFAKFFVNELKKNRTNNKRHTRKIYTKEIDCFNYSNRLYKRCRFYWHKQTSKHNRKLCSAAQLLKNDKEKNRYKIYVFMEFCFQKDLKYFINRWVTPSHFYCLSACDQ